jgi:hypothetical protein
MHRGVRALLVVLATMTATVNGAMTDEAFAATDQTLVEGFPLKLADAFPIATGEGAILVGSGLSLQRQSANRGVFPIAVQYGLLPRTQVSASTVLVTDPRDVSDPGSGDLDVNVRVTLSDERFSLPGFAALVGVTFPTGVGSTAYTTEAKLYATKSLSAALAVHASAAADVLDRVGSGERRARYHVVAGPALVVPSLATLVLMADAFADQAPRKGERDAIGVEVGLRHRVTESLYWHAGMGTELVGSSDRSPFYVTIGVSIGFSAPGR